MALIKQSQQPIEKQVIDTTPIYESQLATIASPYQALKDSEARGKTRCVLYGNALMSPALAGLQFKTIEEFLVLVRKAADDGVKYSFGDK